MKFINWLIKTCVFGFIAFVVIMMGLYAYAYISPSLDIKSSNNIQIYDKDEMVISKGSNSDWTKLEDISPYLIDAVISIEDKNFYSHQGFDYLRIAKAMFENIKNKAIVQGASTISQQYIKNLYLDFDKTWKRKIEEAFLTLQLEVHFSKDEILEGYLNTINYGQGNYGITNASRYYFGKEPRKLTLEESIILAGIPKNPSNYNPVSNYEKCIERAKIVANAMVNNDNLNASDLDTLFINPLNIKGSNDDENLKMIMYYNDAVLEELNTIKEIPTSLITSKGLKIYTYFDQDAQNSLEDAINKNITDSDIQVASVIVDPNTGGVLAMSGGRDYSLSQYNRATKAKRQVGSTMKSFLYYAALENNFVSSTTFTSEKTNFNLSNGQIYSPNNYNNQYANKNITMATAIALSDNIYAVKTNLFLGPETMVEVAQRTGIKGKLNPVVSLALGTSELSMLDFANGYATFASGGYQKDVHLIRKVEDVNGNVLYEYKDDSELVLNPNYSYILSEMLCNTSNSVFSDYTVPSALSIKGKLTNKYAIKTGTTNTDYWIAGYNPDIMMMVWVGYDDNREVSKSENMYTKNIWADTVENFMKDKETNWYEKPKNVIATLKDAITGENVIDKSKATLYYYVKGSENLVSIEKEATYN
ncbi:MAG: penicillin-binding protein [Bacilli bacterium]|nr:penicillin-binding protein [Bacilli bacterium]